MNNNATTAERGIILDADESAVIEYLRKHPDFFNQYPELLTELQVNHQNEGIVSLTQIQLEQYRAKVKKQKRQLESFINNAARNEQIYLAYADLNFAISKSQSVTEVEQHLQTHLCSVLGMDAVSMTVVSAPYNRLPELPNYSLLHKKLAKRDVYLGRLSKHEKEALFGDIDVGSVALVKIEMQQHTGILSVAASDDAHFSPDMDTRLLDYLRLYLEFHLQRILDK